MKELAKKIARVCAKLLIGILVLFVLCFTAVWTVLKVPAVQQFLVGKATHFVSHKTQTRVELGEIDLAFPKSLVLERLFLEDKHSDTLLYAEEVEIDIEMWGLLQKKVNVGKFGLTNVHAQLKRGVRLKEFNFQFLIDAFATKTPKEEIKKDTVQSPWKVDIKQLVVDRLRFALQDSTGSIFLHSAIHQLKVDIETLNLVDKQVAIEDVFMDGMQVDLIKLKSLLPIDTVSKGTAWNGIKIDDLTIQHSRFLYEDRFLDTKILAEIGQSALKEADIDLAKQKVSLSDFMLSNSRSELVLRKDTVLPKSVAKTKQAPSPSLPWTVAAKNIRADSVDFKLDYKGVRPLPKGIDYNHLHITGLAAQVEQVFSKGEVLQANISKLALQEQSGLGIRSLRAQVAMDPTHILLKGLDMTTNYSHLETSATLSYPSMAELLATGRVKLQMARTQVAVQDLLLLVPALEQNPLIAKNQSRKVKIELSANGTMKALKVEKMQVQTADSTSLALTGWVKNASDPKQLYLDLVIDQVNTTNKDLQQLLTAGILPQSIALPSRIHLSGSYKGSLSDFNTHMRLVSSDGSASVAAHIQQLGTPAPHYSVDLNASNYALGRLLKQNTLGRLTGYVKASGQGFDKNKAKAQVESRIHAIGFQNYTYRHIAFKGEVDAGLANLQASIEDTNLAVNVQGQVGFIPSKEHYALKVHLLGADLYRLGLNAQHLQVSAHSEIDFKGSGMNNLNGRMDVRDILIVKNNKEYRIDSLLFASVNDPTGNSMSLESTLLTAKFNGNIDVLSVAPTIMAHANRYFGFQEKQKGNVKPQNFEFQVKINESPIIREVLLPSLTSYKSLDMKGGFDSAKDRMWLEMQLPKATYGSNALQNMHFKVDSDKEAASYELSLASYQNGSVQLDRTSLSGTIKNDTAQVNLMVADTLQGHKLSLRSFLTHGSGDNYRFVIRPDGFSLKNTAWEVNEHNYIEFGKQMLYVHELALHNKTQSLSVQSTSRQVDADLQVSIKNLNLHTLSQIAEKKDSLVRGIINGAIVLQDYQTKPSFTSNIHFSQLAYKKSEMGEINVKADNLTQNRISVQATVTGKGNNIQIDGHYDPSEQAKAKALHFNVDVNALQLASFEALSGNQISRSSGALKGKLKIEGSANKPDVLGSLTFNEVHTKVEYLNSYLYFKNETIQMTSKGIEFSSFTIRDTLNNTAVIDGAVLIPSYDNVSFNLNIQSEDFMVLNTTAVNNKMYYGTIILDSDIQLRGTPSLPKVVAKINMSRGSKFTFAVPESKLSVDRGEGVMEFVYELEDMHPIMMRREFDKLKTSSLKGLDVNAKIRVRPHTSLKILMDPYSGDSLVVRGDADVNFGIDPSGKISLSGIYTLSDGKYKAYIENITSKEFELVKGGKIIWNGDPLDAQVDLMARYKVRTSSSELMTIGGGSTGVISDSSALKRPLLFDVYLIMRGELLKPVISFKLDMPENQRSEGGGVIYAKVNELNENEAELNKQVFSLLVLNKFISATPNGGGGGGMSGFARSSVSRLMSDQLNQLSSQYLKGVEVNVDVQSYNYSQGGKSQANTQVNVGVKKSFDRLTVQVGSNVKLEGKSAQQNNVNNLTGDVQVGYKLTEDGRYQLKAFRQNQIDNVVNGVITETGVGVLYTREYNKTKELFTPPKKRGNHKKPSKKE